MTRKLLGILLIIIAVFLVMNVIAQMPLLFKSSFGNTYEITKAITIAFINILMAALALFIFKKGQNLMKSKQAE